MNILLIHNYYRDRGGEETYVESLSKLLKDKGHSVYLYTKNSRNIKNNIASQLKITKNLFHNATVRNELEDIINTFKPDIAHANNVYPLLSPQIYETLAICNIPIVQTIHNYRLLCPKGTLFREDKICELCVTKRFKYPSIIHRCYQHSTAASLAMSASYFYHRQNGSYNKISKFIFPSKFTLDYHLRFMPELRSRSTFLPYFVEENNIKRSSPFEYFLYLGRFSEEKGIEELMRLFEKMPEIRLIAAGDGPLKRGLMQKYKNTKNITILEHQNKTVIQKLLSHAISLIIPSKWFEVLPFVYLEAMASGTPVLTPQTPVFQRTIEKNEYYYFEPDLSNLETKIRFLNSHKYLKHSFKEEFQSRFTKEVHYKKIMEIYNQVINV